MGKLISKRYSIALFELAKEEEKVDKINEEIQTVYLSIKNNKEFLSILSHPRIGGEEKLMLFKNTFDGLSEDVLGLISIVCKNNREDCFVEIFEEFLNLVKEYKGIADVLIQSASELTDEQMQKLKEKLEQKLNKKIIIQAEISDDLIGGMLISVNGKTIDNSIKKELKNIKKCLIKN